MNETAAHPFKCNVSKETIIGMAGRVDHLGNDDLVCVYVALHSECMYNVHVYLNLHATDMQAEQNLTGINDRKPLEL